MTRREFLRAISLAAACGMAPAMASACIRGGGGPADMGAAESSLGATEPASLPATEVALETALAPTPAVEGRRTVAQVAFVKTRDRAEGVDRAIDLLDLDPLIGMDLFIKPNFNSADIAPGSTHDDTLVPLVRRLQAMGAGRLTVGDRSGMGYTRGVMEEKGIFGMGEELGFDTIAFDELDESGWEMLDVPGGHWERGFAVARPILDADAVIQACCLKTHQHGGHFTMSLKNSVGLVAKTVPGGGHNYMTELHASRNQREMIAEINAAYSPALIVLDGVEAFVSRGPAKGVVVEPNVVLAGTDRIAIDAVGVAILRYFGTTKFVTEGPIFGQAQIARAVELGLGVGSPGEIELVTDDPESATFAAEIRQILDQG